MSVVAGVTHGSAEQASIDPHSQSARRSPIWFWLLGIALVVYVAVCTGQRQNNLGADAWEHHRAVLALTRHLWKPGNPTYASDVPSVRYSPYTVFWALICRATGITPYTALSAAAVVNTILLVLGVWLLLAAFGQAAAASAVLLVMVLLYGGIPSWANSYALADLPWHQVNPSAFSFALVLIAWSIFRRASCDANRRMIRLAIVVILMAIATLDHGMTGAFGIIGLFVLALVAPTQSARFGMITAAVGIGIAVGALCLSWPWYSFWQAVLWKGDNDFWFNRAFLTWELTLWAFPAAGCALFALPLIRRPIIRWGALGALLTLAASIVAYLRHSAILARFPLPGMIYLHIMVGIFAFQSGVFRPTTWPRRLRSMFLPPQQASPAILEVTLAVVLLRCAAPQVIQIATQPFLARPYLVALLHHGENRQTRLPQDLAQLLGPVQEHDVVLSDPQTSWLIPSFNGRIVAGLHYELFIHDQRQRMQDVTDFFTDTSDQRRQQIIQHYGVRWIVLNRQTIGSSEYDALLRPTAIIAKIDGLVLMDVSRWLAAQSPAR
jgi:hypothetical protein